MRFLCIFYVHIATALGYTEFCYSKLKQLCFAMRAFVYAVCSRNIASASWLYFDKLFSIDDCSTVCLKRTNIFLLYPFFGGHIWLFNQNFGLLFIKIVYSLCSKQETRMTISYWIWREKGKLHPDLSHRVRSTKQPYWTSAKTKSQISLPK